MIKLILLLSALTFLQSCHDGSDQIQRNREYELQREEEYNNRKNPIHPSDDIEQ